ncbi:hypothetical protein IGI04_019849, partial [Brassica rapa subsp. trilocularis]
IQSPLICCTFNFPTNINLSNHSRDVIKRAVGRGMKPGHEQNDPLENSPEKSPETVRPSDLNPTIVLHQALGLPIPTPTLSVGT